MSEKKKPGRPRQPDSKRAQGVDRHTLPRKAFHADQELFDLLAKYVAETKPPPTEAGAIRLALEEFLASRGYRRASRSV